MPTETADALIARLTTEKFRNARADADALADAARYAHRRAPAPDEWDVTLMGPHSATTFLRARWTGSDRYSVTLRIVRTQVTGQWVATPSGQIDRSTLILLTHATTWAGVVLEKLAAHGERAALRLFNDDDARNAAEAVFRTFEENENADAV